jgi:hypothetical protein
LKLLKSGIEKTCIIAYNILETAGQEHPHINRKYFYYHCVKLPLKGIIERCRRGVGEKSVVITRDMFEVHISKNVIFVKKIEELLRKLL